MDPPMFDRIHEPLLAILGIAIVVALFVGVLAGH
jgi:hypothetical protein